MDITASYVIPKEMRDKIAALAKAQDMSASKYAKRIFTEHLRAQDEQNRIERIRSDSSGREV